jgi:hypothetical protein
MNNHLPINWFEALFGIKEAALLHGSSTYDKIHQSFDLINEDSDQGILYSKYNQKSYQFGRLELASLSELRAQVAGILSQQAPKSIGMKNQLSQEIGDVKEFHKNPKNNHALFQVASQFNLLEMPSKSCIPEEGIDQYNFDGTQGPACALSAAAGTLYRNYFIKVDPQDSQRGQFKQRQIYTLDEFEKALNIEFNYKNGYATLDLYDRSIVNQAIEELTEAEKDELKGKIKYGIQWNTEVTTVPSKEQFVQQIYCSAIPMNEYEQESYATMATLVQDALYEATLLTAIINQAKNGSSRVFLTTVGGGFFYNADAWIFDALEKAMRSIPQVGLEVIMVCRKNFKAEITQIIENLED